MEIQRLFVVWAVPELLNFILFHLTSIALQNTVPADLTVNRHKNKIC